jgi:hypothetical protein
MFAGEECLNKGTHHSVPSLFIELVRLIDDIPDLVTNYYLLAHRDLQRTPLVRAFFDFVATEIKAFRTILTGEAQGKGHGTDLPMIDSQLPVR